MDSLYSKWSELFQSKVYNDIQMAFYQTQLLMYVVCEFVINGTSIATASAATTAAATEASAGEVDGKMNGLVDETTKQLSELQKMMNPTRIWWLVSYIDDPEVKKPNALEMHLKHLQILLRFIEIQRELMEMPTDHPIYQGKKKKALDKIELGEMVTMIKGLDKQVSSRLPQELTKLVFDINVDDESLESKYKELLLDQENCLVDEDQELFDRYQRIVKEFEKKKLLNWFESEGNLYYECVQHFYENNQGGDYVRVFQLLDR
jgi:hypothetical protein